MWAHSFSLSNFCCVYESRLKGAHKHSPIPSIWFSRSGAGPKNLPHIFPDDTTRLVQRVMLFQTPCNSERLHTNTNSQIPRDSSFSEFVLLKRSDEKNHEISMEISRTSLWDSVSTVGKDFSFDLYNPGFDHQLHSLFLIFYFVSLIKYSSSPSAQPSLVC